MAGQQERKESRAAMARRENGKREEKGKEVDVKKFGQRFCTVFSAQESGERLRIPPSFSQYLENEIGLVYLFGQSGNRWLADLASDTEGFFFENGWKDFVTDHSIEEGHILTFCYNGDSHFSVVIFDEMYIEKPSAFRAKPSYDLVATTERDEEDKQISSAPLEENNGTKRNRTGEIDANSSKLRKRSDVASIDYKSASRNGTEDVMRVQRQPAVMSQRPPVSQGWKNYALQKAKQYKSKYPITLQIMKKTYVYKTYFMIIPSEFVREYLPHTDKKLTLFDPYGNVWEVTYVYCSQRYAGAFSEGWGKFSLGNHLEEFDVCVFELLSEDIIKVHIYRANAMLTQYLLDSSDE
uniref:Uncharacterized protein n=1 Tax=Avena sativa TaxID=4498 RepID=A0ACD5X8L2_AVESA